MSTDLVTQLAEYGEHHRDVQIPIRPGEVADRNLRRSRASRPNYPLRRAGAALGAAALVTALVAIPALLRGPETGGPADSVATTILLEVPSTVPETLPEETPTDITYRVGPIEEGESHELIMVHSLSDGSMIGLALSSVWRSTDEGKTWDEWYAQNHEIDLLAIAPDGAVLAVRNPNETTEALGVGSVVNGTPEVHRFDPATEVWTVIPLLRPELPSPDLTPQAEDLDECGLFGLQSWVDGNSIAVGEQIVILGDHRVVGQGICDEDFQFLWSSPDGIDWTLVPDIGIEGYLTGIIWHGNEYLGYGGPRPSYVGGWSDQVKVWGSATLETWPERPLDLTMLPDGARILAWPRVRSGEDISLTYDVVGAVPGLDSSLTDLDDLTNWLSEAGHPDDPGLEEFLAEIEVDFPLDEREVELLNSVFDLTQPLGTLTLNTANGTDWEADFTE